MLPQCTYVMCFFYLKFMVIVYAAHVGLRISLNARFLVTVASISPYVAPSSFYRFYNAYHAVSIWRENTMLLRGDRRNRDAGGGIWRRYSSRRDAHLAATPFHLFLSAFNDAAGTDINASRAAAFSGTRDNRSLRAWRCSLRSIHGHDELSMQQPSLKDIRARRLAMQSVKHRHTWKAATHISYRRVKTEYLGTGISNRLGAVASGRVVGRRALNIHLYLLDVLDLPVNILGERTRPRPAPLLSTVQHRRLAATLGHRAQAFTLLSAKA